MLGLTSNTDRVCPIRSLNLQTYICEANVLVSVLSLLRIFESCMLLPSWQACHMNFVSWHVHRRLHLALPFYP